MTSRNTKNTSGRPMTEETLDEVTRRNRLEKKEAKKSLFTGALRVPITGEETYLLQSPVEERLADTTEPTTGKSRLSSLPSPLSAKALLQTTQNLQICRDIIDQVLDGMEYTDDLDATGTGEILSQPALVLEGIADDAIIDVETLSVEAKLSVVAAYPRVEPIMMNLSSQRFIEAFAAMSQAIRSSWKFHETFTGVALPPLETQANIGSLSLVVYRGQQTRLSETDADTFQSLLPYSTEGWQVQRVQVTTSDFVKNFVKHSAQEILLDVEEIKLGVETVCGAFINDCQKRMQRLVKTDSRLRSVIQKRDEVIQKRDARIQKLEEFIVGQRERMVELERVIVDMRRQNVTQLVRQFMPSEQITSVLEVVQTTSVQAQVQASDSHAVVQAATNATIAVVDTIERVNEPTAVADTTEEVNTATVTDTIEPINAPAAVTAASNHNSTTNTHGFTGVCMLSVWWLVLVAISAWNGAFNSLAAWMGFVWILVFSVSTMKTGLIRFINEYRKPEIERGLLAVEVLHKWGSYTEYLQDCIAKKELHLERKYAKKYEKMQKDFRQGYEDIIRALAEQIDSLTESSQINDAAIVEVAAEANHNAEIIATVSFLVDAVALTEVQRIVQVETANNANTKASIEKAVASAFAGVDTRMEIINDTCLELIHSAEAAVAAAEAGLAVARFIGDAASGEAVAAAGVQTAVMVMLHAAAGVSFAAEAAQAIAAIPSTAAHAAAIAAVTAAEAVAAEQATMQFANEEATTDNTSMKHLDFQDKAFAAAHEEAALGDAALMEAALKKAALEEASLAIIPLQAKMRRVFALQQHSQMVSAVFRIQVNLRGHHAREQMRVMRKEANALKQHSIAAIMLLQAKMQRTLHRQHLQMVSAALRIQVNLRGHNARKQMLVTIGDEVALNKAQMVSAAALRIQVNFRGHHARMRVRSEVQAKPITKAAAQESETGDFQSEVTKAGPITTDETSLQLAEASRKDDVTEETSFLANDRERAKSFKVKLTRFLPQFTSEYAQEMHPCMSCCDFMRSLFIAEQILQCNEFTAENSWARGFDREKHQIWINLWDVEFLHGLINGPYDLSMGVMAWLLTKYKHYGYVFKERDFISRMYSTRSQLTRELNCYLSFVDAKVDKYTTLESMQSYQQMQAQGLTLTEEQISKFYLPMSRRQCYITFLASAATETAVDEAAVDEAAVDEAGNAAATAAVRSPR